MKITFLCVTEEKISFTDGVDSWFKQYAIGEFENEKERYDFATKYKMQEALNYLNPCVGMRRRVNIVNKNNYALDWEFLTIEKDIYTAALNIGDSDYYNGISLDHIHEQVMRYSNKMNLLQKELMELQDKISDKHGKNTLLEQNYQDQYDTELKKNKLYNKIHNGVIVDEDILNKIRSPIQNKYREELNKINNIIKSIQKELSEMKVQDF